MLARYSISIYIIILIWKLMFIVVLYCLYTWCVQNFAGF